MSRSPAERTARAAGWCACAFFLLGLASCGASGIGQGGSMTAVFLGFLLHVLGLAALIVWLTARDIAGDPRPQPPGRRGFEPMLKQPPAAQEASRKKPE